VGETHDGQGNPKPSAMKELNKTRNMSSYRRILYHLVFRTKNSEPSLNPNYASELYAYTSGIVKNKNCFLYRINGVENHVHLLSENQQEHHKNLSFEDELKKLLQENGIDFNTDFFP